jgi:hypothetical protein
MFFDATLLPPDRAIDACPVICSFISKLFSGDPRSPW